MEQQLPNPNDFMSASEDMMRGTLEKKLADVDRRHKALGAKEYINKNRFRKMKTELLGELFRKLKELGVDPGNPDSIGRFLESLEKQDPDLVTLFEFILNMGTPDEDKPKMAPEAGPNLMDNKVAGLGQAAMGLGNSVQGPEIPPITSGDGMV